MNKIVAAAILGDDGLWVLPAPNRHHNIIWHMAFVTDRRRGYSEAVQGFVDADGKFLDRSQAAERALRLGQIPEPKKYLYSEDLW